MIDIEKFVDEKHIVSPMMTYWRVVSVLKNLQHVLENKTPGAVVELGCNVGTTSVFIRRLLNHYKSDKEYHVYDSWQGLPEKLEQDAPKIETEWRFEQGECTTSRERFERHFNWRKLDKPVIHSGWFKDIPDSEYPEQICFAFFDGDFYSSIIDSFDKVFDKMAPGGIIFVDDCGWDVLPGVEQACEEYLRGRPEKLDLTGYPDENGVYGGRHGGGIIRIV